MAAGLQPLSAPPMAPTPSSELQGQHKRSYGAQSRRSRRSRRSRQSFWPRPPRDVQPLTDPTSLATTRHKLKGRIAASIRTGQVKLAH